jgi:hypothetical protein
MTSLVRSAPLDPGDPVHALLSLEQPEPLHAAVNALDPEDAALAIGRAPLIEDKSRLVWALEPDHRTDVLDQLHPGFVGALIQNREQENKRLLGSVSREQFTRLLRYCSPERAYYWLTLATSFEDARANMLPMLIPLEELAAALLTVPEFVTHCQEVGEYNVGEFQLDMDDFLDVASATVTVYGPNGVVEEFPILEDFPVRDPRLRRVLHTLEHHPEQFTATVTVISTEGAMEELPIRDPRLRRLLHKLLDYDLEQYTAIVNLFGPEGVLREFPVRHRGLRRLLQSILDHDPEHYIDLIQAALQLSDYRGDHAEESQLVSEEPILLEALLSIDEERARAGLVPSVEMLEGGASMGTSGGSTVSLSPSAAPPRAAALGPDQSPTDQEPETGGNMTFLSRSASLDPGDPVHDLLSLQETEALRAAVNALDPEDAALAVGRAPTIEEKSRLIWALEPDRRAEVLDQLHPGFVGALIQNREAENKALLGDLSREQFTRLLRYCSPERAYYWLTLATSFEDARANLLPLLVPLSELAAALLTAPEFENHCCAIGDYNVEDLRIDLHGFKDLALAIVTVFGPDGMLKAFPIRDPRLRQILQTILDHDPEHYAALIHAALELSDYEGNHPEEQEVVSEDPILLDDLLTIEEERVRAGLAAPEVEASRHQAADIRSVPSLPAQQSAELMRSAAGMLPAQRQTELSQEMQFLFLQEAAYAGGSFAEADLEQAAGRVQSYLQLGLAALADGDTEQAARLLSEQRLRTLMESGARQVERMRQVALRLLPWHEVLDSRQIRLLQSLEHPDLGVEAESARPVLRLRPARGGAAESLELETARQELEQVSAWITLVRAVGKARIALRMQDATAAALTRSLVVAAILYRHWDPALVEPADHQRFRETYLDPATGRFTPAAYHALAEAIRTLAAERKLDTATLQDIARLLARAMDELAASGTE